MPRTKKEKVPQKKSFQLVVMFGTNKRQLWRTDEDGSTSYIEFEVSEIGDIITYLSEIQ